MVKTLGAGLWALVVAVVMLCLLLFALPLATLPGLPADVRIIEGARVAEGGALLTSEGLGSKHLHWRWCPASGPLALCITLTGPGGFAQGLVTPGLGSLRVSELTFTGLPVAALGLAPELLQGQIDGEINDLLVYIRGDCLFIDPSRARGEGTLSRLRVMGQRASDHRFALASHPQTGESRLQISGDGVNGNLTLSADGSATGELALQQASTPSGGAASLAINQVLPCAATHMAGR